MARSRDSARKAVLCCRGVYLEAFERSMARRVDAGVAPVWRVEIVTPENNKDPIETFVDSVDNFLDVSSSNLNRFGVYPKPITVC